MKEALIDRLYWYIAANNPDLLASLQQDGMTDDYIKAKSDGIDGLLEELISHGTPAYIIRDRCMEVLTGDLRPSRPNYLSLVLEEEHPGTFERFSNNGMLIHEVINLIRTCAPIFDSFGFSLANEDDGLLRTSISDSINKYLQQQSQQR